MKSFSSLTSELQCVLYHTNKVYIKDTKYLCLSYDTLAFILLITTSLFSSWIASFVVSDLKEIQNSLLIVGLAFVVF